MPSSEVEYYDNDYDLLYFLLRKDIEGYLTDETIPKINVIVDIEYNKIPDNNAKLLSKIGNKTVTFLYFFQIYSIIS